MTHTDLQQLPTLLDILENIALCEEMFQLNQDMPKGLFPTHYQEGFFETMVVEDGSTQLWPLGLLPYIYFRGQSSYYPVCKPNLFRKGMVPSKVFLERLRACELEIVMKQHPMVDIFKNKTFLTFPDGSLRHISLSIDYLALAQHYGICTELLDLTVNKWVAAFFACTKFVNGVYEPILDTDSYGVFYEYELPVRDMFPGKKAIQRKLRAVGLQPFSRPGEQAGFVLQMTEEEDFNNLCPKQVKFRHDPEVSKLIFNYANRSKKLFPYELLQDKAKVIKETTSFSREAYNYTLARYFSTTHRDIIASWKLAENIEILNKPIIEFTDQEKAVFLKEWPKKEKDFYSRIIPRFTYNGPIKERII